MLVSYRTVAYPCITCGSEVRPRQQALLCSGCNRWQHRTCGTGVTQTEYRQAIKTKTDVNWECSDCGTPSTQTTTSTSTSASTTQTTTSTSASTTQTTTSTSTPPTPSSSATQTAKSTPTCTTRITSSTTTISSQSATQHSTPLQSTPVAGFTISPQFASLVASPVLPMTTSHSTTSFTTATQPIRLVASVYDSSSDSSLDTSYQLAPPTSPTSPSNLQPPASTSPHTSHLRENSAVSFHDPTYLEESNLQSSIPTPDMDTTDEDLPLFKIVIGGSKKGGDILVNHGYTYNKDGKPNSKGDQRWKCSVRTKKLNCLASVTQRGDTFTTGKHQHICSPKDAAIPTANIRAQIRTQGKERPFASGATIVKEALQQHLPTDAPATSLPSMSAMIRSTNRLRQKRRPKHPKDLKFKWIQEELPTNFTVKDVFVKIKENTARHIVMFTAALLSLLSKSKTWYVDGKYKAVQHPFHQLWSVHAFVRQNDSTKQVPLMFVLMSRRTKQDYVKVLEYIRDLLPSACVTSVVMDFEAGVWGAFREVYNGIKIRGCVFHWTQAIWKQIQDKGLAPTYRKRKNTAKFLRELMCLPFLPAEQISITFQDFQDLVLPDHPPAIQELLDYVDRNWINGHIWTPTDWSVFGMSVRTNNDVEGWHHHLNQLCDRVGHDNVNLYELIDVLFKESQLVSTQCQLVCEEKLQRYQRKKFRDYQEEIFKIWQDYREKLIKPHGLLQKISAHHHPPTA